MSDLLPCPFCGVPGTIIDVGLLQMTDVKCNDRECTVNPRASYMGRERAIEAWNMRAIAPAPQWISVKERLPAPDMQVLAYIPSHAGDIVIGWLCCSGEWYDGKYFFIPTHWMPLPPLPAEPESAK